MIKLPNGNTLEVDMKPGFLEAVASSLGLQRACDVSDDHIRLYLFGTLKSAIDRAENEHRNIA